MTNLVHSDFCYITGRSVIDKDTSHQAVGCVLSQFVVRTDSIATKLIQNPGNLSGKIPKWQECS
ncbi:hypothetical protein Smp_137400 [Schistosoma mansoni]|uniref:Transposase n=1 Tax=Schistosoma mansoni TaxID=6183 RepID=G4V626_SCHMA|nr:hypothetical protein Smp_137400 [Schistosoma mansoni]|eukprot:XP_018648581.1 hypothetical protein Smp_137400 [Schistosoma mansoni]